MIPRPYRSRQSLAKSISLLLAALAASPLFAADFYKADNEVSLNSAVTAVPGAPWVNFDGTAVAAVPGNTANTDTWRWDNRILAATYANDGVQNLSLTADRWTGNLIFTDMGAPVVITGTTGISLTVSTGIDMSAATNDVTFQTFNTGSNVGIRLSAGAASYTFSVAAGRTLTFNAAKIAVRSGGSNSVVNFPGPGKVVFNDQFQPSHAVITGGRVEFNSLTGSTRIATATTGTPVPPISYTDINGGVVMVNNTSGSATGESIVNVNDTATLGGAGKITGTSANITANTSNSVVNANSGSTLAPGNDGVGTLSIGKLVLNTGSKIAWEANNTSSADLITITGTNSTVNSVTVNALTINGGTIYLYNPGTTTPLSATGLFDLIKYIGTIGGSLGNLSIAESTKIPGYTYTLIPGTGVIQLRISNDTITPADWAVDTSSNWSIGTNWTGGAAPDSIGAIARITGPTGATLTAPRTVTLDAPRTVGQLFLTSTQAVTLGGASTLTLNDNGAAASLTTSGANHFVSTPLALTTGGLLATVEDASATLTISGQVSGTGVGIGKAGSGTLLLTADNIYTGTTAVSSGTLLIGNGGATGSVGGPIDVGSTVKFNRSAAITLSSTISGTGNVEFNGAGTVTLPLANTYTGTTKIGAAGSLVLAHADALKSSTLDYTVSGGTVTVADPVAAINLGGLKGDRPFPLTNTIGTAIALNVGANGASTSYSGSPIGTGASLTKSGSGTLTLTGVHAYSGATTVNGGTLSLDLGSTLTTTAATTPTATAAANAKILVNGGTLTVSAASTISNVSAGLAVAAGTANFNGGIANEASNSSGNPFVNVTGGTLNASSINLSRGGLSLTSEPTSGQTANGLYINGGTVNVTSTVGIGAVSGANSSVSGRMDAGSLTIGGALTVGISNASGNSRWSVLDINGGTLTVTDATTGILLSGADTAANFGTYATLLIRKSSAVVTAQRIQFGQGALTGSSTLNLSAGSLYLGSGGMVLGSSAPTFVPAIRLSGGTLGATADWSTTIPVTLAGTGAVVSGADANDVPHTITLQGTATGLVSLTKKGSGTVIFESPSNDIFGPTVVQAGVLKLAGVTSQPVTVNTGATFAPLGAFSVAFDNIDTSEGNTINGTLAIGYNALAATPVSSLRAVNGTITLGAGATLAISGTGVLPGPAYVILKAPGAINGTFASVTGIPAGFHLDQAYDDDADPGTPPVIALVGAGVSSPYDSWTASYSLSGNDALPTADPDGDGMNNLLEYALVTSPIVSDTADAYTVGRSGTHLTLAFDHTGDSTLTYAVEATNDLVTPFAVIQTFAPYTTPGSEVFTDTAVDLTITPRRFLRLKVTKAP